MTEHLACGRVGHDIYSAEYEKDVSRILHGLKWRKSPQWFANEATEPTALYTDVCNEISTGDLALHSGRHIFSFGVRFFSYSRWSHAGFWYRDEHGKLWIADVCEGTGGSLREPLVEIEKCPGRWSWSHVSRRRFPDFNNDKVGKEIKEMVKDKYGYAGIALQFALHAPLLREFAYVLKMDRLRYFENRPFCSQAVCRTVRRACLSCDPVPDRAEALVVPQDLAQSRLWSEDKVAIFPDEETLQKYVKG